MLIYAGVLPAERNASGTRDFRRCEKPHAQIVRHLIFAALALQSNLIHIHVSTLYNG